MPQLDLELILLPDSIYCISSYIELPISIHVHKRLEQFRYLNSINDNSIPISYLGNQAITAKDNLMIINKAHGLLANSKSLLTATKYDVVVSMTYSSAYSSILATNKTFVNRKGTEQPLFYRHKLPVNTKEVSVVQVRNGNSLPVSDGYIVDLDDGNIYTNHQNQFDFETNSHKLFYISGSTTDGVVFNTLLNSVPVAKEATWEDIDLDTGELVDIYPLYSKSKSGTGYTFSFNKGDRWFIKVHDKSLVQPRRPKNNSPRSPWFLRITNGDVSGAVNSAVRRYYIPEYNTQPFIPYNPILYGTKEELVFVNKRILASSRGNLKIDPDNSLHLDIRVQDAEGNLIKVFTTNASLNGERVGNTDVFYESDVIASWDERNGFIQLSNDLFTQWSYSAKYYYEADDYEYTRVNLNPIVNRNLINHYYVFYCIPDVYAADNAIHHLLVNSDGYIVEASQSAGIGYPNLQLLNSDGTYNTNTIIGSKYVSEVSSSFVDTYTTGYSNSYAYLILAEISAISINTSSSQVNVDLQKSGGTIKESFYGSAFKANPRLLQSKHGYGERGQVIPETNVMILEPELSLLTEYGGNLVKAQVEGLLKTHMPSNGYAVINWQHPKSLLTATSYVTSEVELTITWEGFYTYKLYRRDSSADLWTLVTQFVNPAEGLITYTDTLLSSGGRYEYSVSLTKNSVEYPKGYSIAIIVR